MAIFSYKKIIKGQYSYEFTPPMMDPAKPSTMNDFAELATIGDTTYIYIDSDCNFPEQSDEVNDTLTEVILTPGLSAAIKSASPLIKDINERVQQLISSKYTIQDEIKILRIGNPVETETYNKYVEECRAKGRAMKAAYGL